jgi:hypothetical protein
MAKTPATSNKPTKTSLQNRRTENKMYQMACLNCDWKGTKSQFRSAVNAEGDQHKRFTRDIKTGKTHRVELGNVTTNT